MNVRPIDADNHYYEPLDAFTRHLDKAFRKRGVRPLQEGKRVELVIGGRVNRFIPNPTFKGWLCWPRRSKWSVAKSAAITHHNDPSRPICPNGLVRGTPPDLWKRSFRKCRAIPCRCVSTSGRPQSPGKPCT